jgi:nicotinamidase-related amidase
MHFQYKMKDKESSLPKPGTATALLVIDVQQGLFEKSTPIYHKEAFLAAVSGLIEQARQAGVPVIFIQHANDTFLIQGSPGWQLHPTIQPLPGEALVHKRHASAFEGTTLEGMLASSQVGVLVICGLVTHGCVKATCQDALLRGYRVTLAQDGHSSFSKDAPRLIDEWNTRLHSAGAQLCPAEQIDYAQPEAAHPV